MRAIFSFKKNISNNESSHIIQEIQFNLKKVLQHCNTGYAIRNQDHYNKAKHILENLDKILDTPSTVEDQSTPLTGDSSLSEQHSDSDFA